MKHFGFTLFLSLFTLSSSAFTLLVNAPGWQTKSLTIYVNNANCSVDLVPLVQDAAELWNSVSTASLKLSVEASSSYTLSGFTSLSYPNIAGVVCDTSFGGTDTTLGLGTYAYGSGNSYGYVRMNASGGSGDISGVERKAQVITLAHELGHALNIGHTNDSSAIMYYSIGTKTDISLSWDDMQAYTYLYPRDEFGGDGMMACGQITNGGPKPPLSMLLLFLPLAFVFYLRRKSFV
jgi:hypothetical protein